MQLLKGTKMTHKKSTNDSTQQTISPLVDIKSLNGFFLDITEYIHEKQHAERGVMTACDIALYAMNKANTHNDSLLKSYSEIVDLMADLGWLGIQPIGTSFNDELLYKFNPIEQGDIHA